MNERFEKYVNNKLGSVDCKKAKRLKENWPVWSFPRWKSERNIRRKGWEEWDGKR